MSPPLTYLEFLALFVVPPSLVLSALAVVRPMRPGRWGGVGLMVGVAFVYTSPWDSYLVQRGVWYYGEGAVSHTVWHVPLGEYLFMVLQAATVALWLYVVLEREEGSAPFRPTDVSGTDRLVGVLAGAAVGTVGLALTTQSPTFYLGAVLAWAAPVLALQWAFSWRYLRVRWRTLLAGVAVPTLYFCLIDRIAIELGVWVVPPRFTTGLFLWGLPVEEAVFFALTAVFVVQGLILLEWVLAAGPWVAGRRFVDFERLGEVVDRWT